MDPPSRPRNPRHPHRLVRVGSLSGGVSGAAAAPLASVAAPLDHLTPLTLTAAARWTARQRLGLAAGCQRADALALLSASLAGARQRLVLFVLALAYLAPLPLLSAAAALAAAFWEISGHQHPVPLAAAELLPPLAEAESGILPLRQLLPL